MLSDEYSPPDIEGSISNPFQPSSAFECRSPPVCCRRQVLIAFRKGVLAATLVLLTVADKHLMYNTHILSR